VHDCTFLPPNTFRHLFYSQQEWLTYPPEWGPNEWGPLPYLPDHDVLVKRMEKQWGELRAYRWEGPRLAFNFETLQEGKGKDVSCRGYSGCGAGGVFTIRSPCSIIQSYTLYMNCRTPC
jgi:hypothetical protein